MARRPIYWQGHRRLANKEGRSSLTKIIQVLCSHPDTTTLKKLSPGLTMSNETFMAHASSRLEEAVRNAGTVVVTLFQMCVMDKKETREKRLTESHLEG